MGKYQVVASEKAKSDLSEVARSGNKPMMRKIEKLIKELAEHPGVTHLSLKAKK